MGIWLGTGIIYNGSDKVNNNEIDEDLDELNPEYEAIINRYSTRIASKEPINYALSSTSTSLYALASEALLSSKIEEGNTSTKVIIPKPSNTIISEPKSYKEAINSSYKEFWLKAMQNEIDSLNKNDTWDIVNSTSTSTSPIKPLKTR